MMNAFVIDAFEFCRLKEYREGVNSLADFPRLAKETVGKTGSIRWSVKGDVDKLGHLQLRLAVAGVIDLICQRCLQPFEFAIQSESVLVLATDEVAADQIESLVDEEFDVIVASQSFNVAELIEDEALLAIPLSPRHEACPDQAEKDGEERNDMPTSPFAVLKNWKQ